MTTVSGQDRADRKLVRGRGQHRICPRIDVTPSACRNS
jgi:hypothetical protein